MSEAPTATDLKRRLEPLLAASGALRAPLIVAVSGGGDSLALTLLAHEAYPGPRPCRDRRSLFAEGGRPPRRAKSPRGVAPAAFPTARCVGRMRSRPPGSRRRRGRRATASLPRPRRKSGRARCPQLVLTAHTFDDQAETVAMRAARGGPTPRSAMRARVEIAGAPPVAVLRPLLDVPRDALRDALRECGQEWIRGSEQRRPSVRARPGAASDRSEQVGLLAGTGRRGLGAPGDGRASRSHEPAIGGEPPRDRPRGVRYPRPRQACGRAKGSRRPPPG